MTLGSLKKISDCRYCIETAVIIVHVHCGDCRITITGLRKNLNPSLSFGKSALLFCLRVLLKSIRAIFV